MIALVLVACFSAAYAQQDPVVQTSLGKVIGRTQLAEDSSACEAWKGIPFAEPPVGALRFAPPVSLTKSFPAEGFNATAYGRWCPQLSDGSDYGDEDCLTLNLWRPTGTSGDSQLAVMVWIYGGAFVNGDDGDNASLNTYDSCGLVARHDVLAVGMNYRVGPLGFAAFDRVGDEGKVDSNFGMMDQREALRWVQREVHAFGGNPNKVTIFGESAGAISVWYHIASPKSKGLFHAAISQSGLPNAVTGTWSTHRTQAYAAKLGCKSRSSLRECLLTKSVKEIIDAADEDANPFTSAGWNPCVDGDDMPLSPGDMINDTRASAVPFLAGYNTNECNAFVYPSFPTGMNVTQFHDFTLASLRKYPQWDPKNALNQTELKQIYDKYPLSKEVDNRQVAADMLSDSSFHCAQAVTGAAYAQRAKFYMYRFNHRTSFSKSPFMPGVYHGLDLPYPFGTPATYNAKFTPEEVDLSNRMQAIWTNFAKEHVPKGGSVPFPEFTNATHKELVLDTPRDSVDSGFRTEFCDFWAKMYAEEGHHVLGSRFGFSPAGSKSHAQSDVFAALTDVYV